MNRRLFCALLPAAAVRSQAAGLEIPVTAAGRPTAARLYITDAEGRVHLVPGAVTFNHRGETHSLIDRRAALSLPAGRYTIRAEKGAEFVPAEKSVTISAAPARIELDLAHLRDMNAQGWYSGDMHVHRKPEEMGLAARAEHLNVLPVITRHVGDGRPAPPAYPGVNLEPVDSTHVVTLQNQEVERLRTGHGAVLLLNTPEPLENDVALLWPLDAEFCRRARKQGGFVDGEKPIWKNVPVNAAFGLLDSIGVVNNHFHPHEVMLEAESFGAMARGEDRYRTPAGFAEWMMDLYYRLLNCGFRLPVSAGSASGIMPSWPGYERVYVHLSGPFSAGQWFRDLKAGRSVGTNGPLLTVKMHGRPPGAEIAWERAAEVRLEIELQSQRPVERLEIVANGAVVRTIQPRSGFHETIPVRMDQPGWLAVRCWEPAPDTIRYAHSSPFYFPKDGRLPVVKADANRWADIVRGIAAGVREQEYPNPLTYQLAQQSFLEAEQFYRRLASA
jgi:hypothetical protein